MALTSLAVSPQIRIGILMFFKDSRRLFAELSALVLATSFISSLGPATGATTWRSGHPPKVVSAQFDDQRRLVVVFSAEDGMTFGGFVVTDNDPVNATPVSVSTYGPLMSCNNKSTCKGMWPLPSYPESTTYTFRSEPLDAQKFPAGTYYLQVDTHNEDPYPSTRQEEFSDIYVVALRASSPAATHKVPLLTTVKLPISNGTPVCTAWRDHLQVGNVLVAVHNAYNKAMNDRLAKLKTFPTSVEKIYQRTLKETAYAKSVLMKALESATSACSDAPSIAAMNGTFVEIPVPSSNGTDACNKSRAHIVYLNQELLKIFNNMRTTAESQTARIKQLGTRFNQLSADLKKSWPVLYKACNPL